MKEVFLLSDVTCIMSAKHMLRKTIEQKLTEKIYMLPTWDQ